MLFRRTNIRQWEIRFYFSFDTYDKERIIRALIWAGAPNSIIDNVSENIEAGRLDEGFTYSNPLDRKSVVGIGMTSSGPEFLNSFVHEVFHLSQDIAVADGISLVGEDIAYLAGDISRSASDIVCEMSCPHCRSI